MYVDGTNIGPLPRGFTPYTLASGHVTLGVSDLHIGQLWYDLHMTRERH